MNEEKEMKREFKLKLNVQTNTWQVIGAKGFYPEKDVFTKEELRVFLRENDDIKPILVY